MSVAAYSVPSVCPSCAGARVGATGAAMLICATCRSATEARPERRAVRVRFVSTRGYEHGLAIPFYRFAGLRPGVEALAANAEAGAAKVNALAAVWTVAVRIRRFQGYGEVGFEYTRRPPRLDDVEPRSILPVARTIDDAEQVARTLVWRAAAEACPPGSFRLTTDLGEPEIWCVPTIEEAGFVKFPHCPIRYPAVQIEGYATATEGC